jgi:hypothetical protein
MNTTLQKILHRVEEYAGNEEFGRDLNQAKEHFFSPVGIPGERGSNPEIELLNFIEWFIFEWPLADGLRIWEKFRGNTNGGFSAEEMEMLNSFSTYNYALFQLKKADPENMTVLDVIADQKIKKVVGMGTALRPGDYFLARLVFFRGQPVMTEALFILPKNMSKLFIRKAKMVRKGKSGKALTVEELRGLAMKAVRYPRMKLEEMYK